LEELFVKRSPLHRGRFNENFPILLFAVLTTGQTIRQKDV